MGITRLARELDVRFSEGGTSLAVDLFDLPHARRVLTAFGRAYGTLPRSLEELGEPQRRFIEQAVNELSENNKVIPIRLALFAEMIKHQRWDLPTLVGLGGAEGVGRDFLEASLCSSSAPLEHRVHQSAACAVLRTFLPKDSSNLRSQERSCEELLEASGYRNRPHDFAELMSILDGKLRLVTPTDSARRPEEANASATPPRRSYQLTHDYLVPTLRDWLTHKQRETWRGRASLRLEERTAQWQRTQETRLLPNLFEYLTILCGVRRNRWTSEQTTMMRSATRRYARIASVFVLMAMLLGWFGWEVLGRVRSAGILDTLYAAKPAELPRIIREDLPSYRRWAEPQLRRVVQDSAHPHRFAASLALLPSDPRQLEFLGEHLLVGSLEEFLVLHESLEPYKARLAPSLWETLHDKTRDHAVRFRAGLALARYEPKSVRWQAADDTLLVHQLLRTNPENQGKLRAILPASPRVVEPVAKNLFRRKGLGTRTPHVSNGLGGVRRGRGAVDVVGLRRNRRSVCGVLPKALRDVRVSTNGEEHLIAYRPTPTGNDSLGIGSSPVRDSASGGRHPLDASGGHKFCLGHFESTRRSRGTHPVCPWMQGSRRARRSVADCLGLCRRAVGAFWLAARFRRLHVRGDSRATALALGSDVETVVRERSDLGDSWSKWLVALSLGGGELRSSSRPHTTPLPSRARMVRAGGESTVSKSDDRWSDRKHAERVPYFCSVRRTEVSGRHSSNGKRTRPGSGTATLGRNNADRCGSRSRIDVESVGFVHPSQLYQTRLLASHRRTSSLGIYLESSGGLLHVADEACGARTLLSRFGWPCRSLEERLSVGDRCGMGILLSSRHRDPFSFGSDDRLLRHYGWCDVNSETKPHPGKQKRPNLRGIFDLHGNAWEWCHDWYIDPQEDRTHFPLVDPIGPDRGIGRVIRGGSWPHRARKCRSGFRGWSVVDEKGDDFGFRLAITLPRSQR